MHFCFGPASKILSKRSEKKMSMLCDRMLLEELGEAIKIPLEKKSVTPTVTVTILDENGETKVYKTQTPNAITQCETEKK